MKPSSMYTNALPVIPFAVACLFWFAMDTNAQTVEAPSEAALKRAADFSKAGKGQTMVVMFEGKIVFERYDNGGSADKVQMLASGSKSFVGLAAVAAVEDKVIKLDDLASQGIIEWRDDPIKSTITYRQLQAC